MLELIHSKESYIEIGNVLIHKEGRKYFKPNPKIYRFNLLSTDQNLNIQVIALNKS